MIPDTSAVRDTSPAMPPIDLVAIKAKQQATWSSGDYSVIGTTCRVVPITE